MCSLSMVMIVGYQRTMETKAKEQWKRKQKRKSLFGYWFKKKKLFLKTENCFLESKTFDDFFDKKQFSHHLL